MVATGACVITLSHQYVTGMQVISPCLPLMFAFMSLLLGTQGDLEFNVEVSIMAGLHHANVVPLLGSCSEADQRVAVFEHMPHGNLRDMLDGKVAAARHFNWPARLNVLLGVAKGLVYLHEVCLTCLLLWPYKLLCLPLLLVRPYTWQRPSLCMSRSDMKLKISFLLLRVLQVACSAIWQGCV